VKNDQSKDKYGPQSADPGLRSSGSVGNLSHEAHGPAGAASAPTARMRRRLVRAFPILQDARACALDLQTTLWTFAIGLGSLLDAGLTMSDLNWLHGKGIIVHARELTGPSSKRRTFKHNPTAAFVRRTWFVLTDDGAAYAARLTEDRISESIGALDQAVDLVGGGVSLKPCWDKSRRELRLRSLLIKRFKVPAPNQERVLDAFQEDGWPSRIDDPLPPSGNRPAKQRLRETVACLNRHQSTACLRFESDGNGLGICFRIVVPKSS